MVGPLPDLQPSEVETWLRSLSPQQICGLSGSSSNCPLAQFLSQALGADCIVTGLRYQGPLTEHGSEERDLPRWAQRFVAAIDTCSQSWWQGQRRVSAAEALQLLQVAVEEAEALQLLQVAVEQARHAAASVER